MIHLNALTLDELQWLTPRIRAYIWSCEDEVCDCTQPCIEVVGPNLLFGYPAIIWHTIWQGDFFSPTNECSTEELKAREAEFRAVVSQFGLPKLDDNLSSILYIRHNVMPIELPTFPHRLAGRGVVLGAGRRCMA